jgi:hypothetical protein
VQIDLDLQPVTVDNVAAMVRAADRHPDRLVSLRVDEPPSRSHLRRYARALGGVHPLERSLAVENDAVAVPATSLEAAPFHTDGACLDRPPSRFLLSFATAQDPDGGGLTTFLPVAVIVAAAPSRVVHALRTARFRFVDYDGDFSGSHDGPVIATADRVSRIRWRSKGGRRPAVVDARGTDAEGALDWLEDHLAATPPPGYAAHRAETLLIPNTLGLHGRTRTTSPGASRDALRAWLV